ncbi:MAG: hypothetical protein ACRD3L_10940 [Terriglobales bacterium]
MKIVKIKENDLYAAEAAGMLFCWLRQQVLEIADVKERRAEKMPPQVRRVIEIIDRLNHPLTRDDPAYAAWEDTVRPPEVKGDIVEYEYPKLQPKTSDTQRPFSQLLAEDFIRSAIRAAVMKTSRYLRAKKELSK